VRRTFLDLASQSRERYVVLDATLTADQIFAVVIARASRLLPATKNTDGAARRSLADVRP
jgi:hypothetical protein